MNSIAGIPLSLSIGIILANVLLFFVFQNNATLLNRMLFDIDAIRRKKEYDRIFLSGFAHFSFFHLLFNMLTLFYFGPYVEYQFGPLIFLLIFIASIAGGNVFTLIMKKDEPGYAALGASGGLFGVIYAFILANPYIKLSLFILPVGIPGWIFGILISLISIVLSQLPRSREAGISHEGHLGGALTGALIAMAFMWDAEFDAARINFLLAGVLPVAAMLLIQILKPQWLKSVRRRF